MMLVYPMLGYEILVKSELDIIKYLDLSIVSSNAMGFRVNLGYHMYVLTVG